MTQRITIANNATLVNGTSYPALLDTAGATKNFIPTIGQYLGLEATAQLCTPYLQIVATFGSATLTPQYSLDGSTWVNLGSALSANGITALPAIPTSAYFRLLVTGSGNVTSATVVLA